MNKLITSGAVVALNIIIPNSWKLQILSGILSITLLVFPYFYATILPGLNYEWCELCLNFTWLISHRCTSTHLVSKFVTGIELFIFFFIPFFFFNFK